MLLNRGAAGAGGDAEVAAGPVNGAIYVIATIGTPLKAEGRQSLGTAKPYNAGKQEELL